MARRRRRYDEYEIEKVIGKRYRNGTVEYNLKWKGYDEESWMELRKCVNCLDMINAYEDEHRDDSEEREETPSNEDSMSMEYSFEEDEMVPCDPSTSNSHNPNEMHGLKIWSFELYEEWLRENGYDTQLAHEAQEVEMFLGREVDKITGHYPYGEKPYFLLRTVPDPHGATLLADILHGVDCVLVCKLFPKTFENHANFVAYTCMRDDLKQHIEAVMD